MTDGCAHYRLVPVLVPLDLGGDIETAGFQRRNQSIQLFLLAIEGIIRRDLSLKVKERINQVGFVLIMMLMVTVLYFDLLKNIPSGLLPGS